MNLCVGCSSAIRSHSCGPQEVIDHDRAFKNDRTRKQETNVDRRQPIE